MEREEGPIDTPGDIIPEFRDGSFPDPVFGRMIEPKIFRNFIDEACRQVEQDSLLIEEDCQKQVALSTPSYRNSTGFSSNWIHARISCEITTGSYRLMASTAC